MKCRADGTHSRHILSELLYDAVRGRFISLHNDDVIPTNNSVDWQVTCPSSCACNG